MEKRVSLFAVGQASSLFLAISYVLCVSFGLLFPDYAMYRAWQDLLPGFEWLNRQSFILGLLESWAYGWYFAVLWVPLYNIFAVRAEK